MIHIQKQWLAPVTWESIVALNDSICQAKKNLHEANAKNFEATRGVWEGGRSKMLSLRAALDVCRRCLEMAPFVFYNANTFSAVGRLLLEDGLKQFPSVEAQVIRTTVSHYIAGTIPPAELAHVLKHFEKLWITLATAPAHVAPTPTQATATPAQAPYLATPRDVPSPRPAV